MDRPLPLPLRPALHLVGLGRRTVTWPVSSQHGSRRNAMLAAAEIRQRVHEQLEVEAFLVSVSPPPAASG